MEHDAIVGGVRLCGLVGALVLAGCASAGCVSAGSADAAPASHPAPAPSIPSIQPVTHALGTTVDADHSFIEVTVYAYQQPVGKGAPAPNSGGYTWAAADVQTCGSNSSIFSASVSGLSWALIYSDNTEVDPARVSYPQFPKPLYPTTQYRLKPGECLRGWVVFPVPESGKPVVVRFAPYGAPPVDWVAAPAN
jgi:hypothetical protein